MARSTSGEQTRERILEAALPLFAEKGFAGTSTRLVADAAGVNVATLAYHFVDKEGLYLTVVQRLHEDLLAGFPTTPPEGGPQQQIDAWIGIAWRFVRAHRQHIRLLQRHVLDRGQHPDVVIDRWSEPLLERAEGIVGLFRPHWPRTDRRLLVLSLMHAMVRFGIEDREQLRAMIHAEGDLDRVVVQWLSGMVRREFGVE